MKLEVPYRLIPRPPRLRFCTLQAIQNWSRGRPGNEAEIDPPSAPNSKLKWLKGEDLARIQKTQVRIPTGSLIYSSNYKYSGKSLTKNRTIFLPTRNAIHHGHFAVH